DVEVTGAATGNGVYDDIDTLVGSLTGSDNHIIIDVDADTTWDLTGLNAGTLTVAGFATAITFSRVENLTGAETAKDTFVIDELAGVTGGIDHRDGDLEIQLFDYFFADGDISIDSHIGDLRLNDDTFFDDV